MSSRWVPYPLERTNNTSFVSYPHLHHTLQWKTQLTPHLTVSHFLSLEHLYFGLAETQACTYIDQTRALKIEWNNANIQHLQQQIKENMKSFLHMVNKTEAVENK